MSDAAKERDKQQEKLKDKVTACRYRENSGENSVYEEETLEQITMAGREMQTNTRLNYQSKTSLRAHK